MKWHEQGLPRVTEWKKYIGDIPLVAIGGMTVERTEGVFEAGADIISVVTDITKQVARKTCEELDRRDTLTKTSSLLART